MKAAGTKLTPKGDARAASILQAATIVLARDGYGGATLGGIAAEAKVDKRSLLYYFGSREQLLVRVVHRLGAEIAARVRIGTPDRDDPHELLDAVVAATWAGVTSEPQPVRAYFALVAGDVEAGEVDDALRATKDIYLELLRDQLRALEAAGWTLRGDLHHSSVALVAMLRGLLLEWLEDGDDGVAETGALEQFKLLMGAQFETSPEGSP